MQGPQPSQDLAPPEIFPINPSVRPWKIPLYLPSPRCDSQCNSQRSSNTLAPLGICLISAGFFPLNTHKALEMRYPTFPPFFFFEQGYEIQTFLLLWCCRAEAADPEILALFMCSQYFGVDGIFHLLHSKQTAPNHCSPRNSLSSLGEIPSGKPKHLFYLFTWEIK